MEENSSKKKFKKIVIKSLLLYNLLFIIIAIICYYLIPFILNYPPNSINNEFEKNIDDGYSYFLQYIVAVAGATLLSNFTIFLELRRINGWEELIIDNEKREKITKIKKICFGAPSKLYLLYAGVPPLAIFIVLLFTGVKPNLIISITMTILVIFVLIGLLIYVFSKRIFDFVLVNMKNMEQYNVKPVLGYRKRIFLQFFPITILTGFIIYMITKTGYYNRISDLLHNEYKMLLQQSNASQSESIDECIQRLNTIQKKNENDTLFIIKPYSIIYKDNNNEISDFIIKYTFWEGKEGKTYGYYASGIEGVFDFIEVDGEKYAIGIMYDTTVNIVLKILAITIFILGIIIISFLLLFAKEIAQSISKVSEYMKNLADGNSVDYDKKIPVTSNDELGNLTVNFNKILDLEKKHVETIRQNQDALVENERLSSLGQLIGGIAHNLKTPIMSISGKLQGIQDLITEYTVSVGDPDVTVEDHKAIAKDMEESVEKIKVYLSYMSDVITAVKGQAVQMDSSESSIFGVSEVVSRIEILMKHELKSSLVELRTNISEEAKLVSLKGDINSLVQVFNNLVQNSIYAYQGRQDGVIEFNVIKENQSLCFIVQDYGCGIPENVKDKLFKEMITTKGKNGTGLGLYMSYSTIKGKFNGTFDFESEVGKGTKFIITIPISE